MKNQLEVLVDPHELELFGQSLTVDQMFILLNLMLESGVSFNEKLSPILAGFSDDHFVNILPRLNLNQLSLLQHESMLIPVQHHLTLLCQIQANDLEVLAIECLNLKKEIVHLQVEEIGFHDLLNQIHRIRQLDKLVEDKLTLLSSALLLAWNSNRIDLIDKLSSLKESFQKYKKNYIGTSKHRVDNGQVNKELDSTGLYADLEGRLSQVYSDIPQSDIPAVEAIAKLSVWCLKDYYEVGLLPDLKSESELELDPLKFSEKERTQYRDYLTEKVVEQLKNLNLVTLDHLINAGIYSKKALKEYVMLFSKSSTI